MSKESRPRSGHPGSSKPIRVVQHGEGIPDVLYHYGERAGSSGLTIVGKFRLLRQGPTSRFAESFNEPECYKKIRSPVSLPVRNRGLRPSIRSSRREGRRRSIFQALFFAVAPWTRRPRSCPESSPGAPRPSTGRRPPRLEMVEKRRRHLIASFTLRAASDALLHLHHRHTGCKRGDRIAVINVSYRKLHGGARRERSSIVHDARVVVVSRWRPVGGGCGARRLLASEANRGTGATMLGRARGPRESKSSRTRQRVVGHGWNTTLRKLNYAR